MKVEFCFAPVRITAETERELIVICDALKASRIPKLIEKARLILKGQRSTQPVLPLEEEEAPTLAPTPAEPPKPTRFWTKPEQPITVDLKLPSRSTGNGAGSPRRRHLRDANSFVYRVVLSHMEKVKGPRSLREIYFELPQLKAGSVGSALTVLYQCGCLTREGTVMHYKYSYSAEGVAKWQKSCAEVNNE
jgi:hypothetical protein